MLSTVLIASFVLSLAALYRYLTKNRGTLEALGVPIDDTSNLSTHKIDFKVRKYEANFRENKLQYISPFQEHDVNCLKKYGRLWGQYSGTRPELFVAEPELLKELMVKRFDDFTDRQHFEMPQKVRL